MAAEKYSQIAETLKTRILSGCYAKRFPAAARLEKEYRVSSRTMAKVYARLKAEHLIETTPAGSFIGKDYLLPENAGVVLLFLNGPHQLPLAEDVLYNTFRDAVRQDGFHLRLCDTADPDCEALIEEFSPAGAVFAYSSWNPVAGAIFQKNRIPQVALNWFSEECDIDCVDGDWNFMLAQLVEQLVKHHYRRIYLQQRLRNGDSSGRYRFHRQCWRKIIAKYDLPDYGNDWRANIPDNPPEVLISFGEPVDPELRQWYRERGIPVHILNLNREVPEEKETCWRYTGFDYAAVAREGWKMLRALIRGGVVAERRLLLKFPCRILFNSTPG